MGGKSSSESGRRGTSRPSSFNHRNRSQGHQWNSPYYHNYPPSESYDAPVEGYRHTQSFSASHAYPPEGYHPKPLNYPQPSQPYSSSSMTEARQLPRLDRRYSKIADNYKSLDE